MSWNGVKKQSIKEEIKSWCEEMRIRNYTINSLGEISVNGNVDLGESNFKELSYKFDRVDGHFDIGSNQNLTSLKNCPNYVRDSFACDFCHQLDSLEGCPKEVGGNFYYRGCKREFVVEEIQRYCKVNIWMIRNGHKIKK